VRASPEPAGLERRAGSGRRAAILAPGAVAAAALLASIALTTTGGAAGRIAYPAYPPPAHTGGFGEPTCHACHFEAEPNTPGGSLSLAGIPDSYLPGESYRLTVVLVRPGMLNAGFQLAARYATGPRAGAQAGELRPLDERSVLTTAGEPGVQYLHHTETGTEVEGPDTARWHFEWIAPVEGSHPAGNGAVVFHLAANAADGDTSPFGDLVYTASQELARGAPGPSSR
jgi:hypothetical protein